MAHVGQPRSGRVETFDEARGIGTVADDAGGSYPFHCTALTDGTRTVAVGTPVVFEVAPTHLGRLEARAITTAPA
jgi:cold shock CspA family protein